MSAPPSPSLTNVLLIKRLNRRNSLILCVRDPGEGNINEIKFEKVITKYLRHIAMASQENEKFIDPISTRLLAKEFTKKANFINTRVVKH